MNGPSDSSVSRAAPGLAVEETLRRRETVLEGQKQALEMAMNGRPLKEVLDALVLCVEQQSQDDIYASILLVSADGNRFVTGSAPNLPPEYNDAVSGLPIGPTNGSCGAAVFFQREVVVTNIAEDPLWSDYKHLVLPFGLHACWSAPIFSSRRQVLATFAVYYKKVQEPDEEDRRSVELLSRTAGIVIEWFSEMTHRGEMEAAIRNRDRHWRALVSATRDMLYRMSADWRTAWTLNDQSFLSDLQDEVVDWQDKHLLPEDRETVGDAINRATRSKTAYELEHRYIRQDGSVGWILSRAIPILDDRGEIVEWYGVASDITSRKRYETSLAETLSLLEAVFKNAPVGYALFNREHQYLQVNDALAQMNGTTPEEHVGKSIRDMLPSNFTNLAKILNHVFATGQALRNVEIRGEVAKRPGVIGAWLGTFYPVIGEDSSEVKFVGAAVVEVTERVHAEEALKESERQFRDFSNSIQNLAWMAHPDGETYWYNQRWYDYTGTTFDDVHGSGWITVFHPDHRADAKAFIGSAWRKGEAWELTMPLRGCDGKYHWFLTRAYPVKDEQGRITKWIGTSTDIDDKWRIQEELRRSEDRLWQVLNFMPQIVWSADPLGHHDFFNERWYTFTGLPFGRILDNPWSQVLHPDDYVRMNDIWRRCLVSGEAYEIQYRMRRHDGVYRWMLARAMPLRGKDDTVERWYGTCTDINDQKMMAENLETLVQERTKELKRSNEDLQQFAHVASHDLKEPVRKIKLFADLIEENYADQLPEIVNRNLQKIQKSARRIAAMIEGVLLYSSLDGATPVLEDVDLNAIIRDVEEDLDIVIAEKKATLLYENLPLISAMHTLIYQLFYNLIRNSLKFSHSVRLPIVRISAEEVTRDGRAFHVIHVEDNGIGFSNQYADAIFVAFTRLHTKDAYEGTGIGLALCKKIVERHGGTISGTGREGEGATFTVELPAHRPAVSH